jgi:hypothetical protein
MPSFQTHLGRGNTLGRWPGVRYPGTWRYVPIVTNKTRGRYVSSLGFVINAHRDCISHTCPSLPTALEAWRGREAQVLKWRYLSTERAWVCLSIKWNHNPRDLIRGGIHQSEFCFLGFVFLFPAKSSIFSSKNRREYFRVYKCIEILSCGVKLLVLQE